MRRGSGLLRAVFALLLIAGAACERGRDGGGDRPEFPFSREQVTVRVGLGFVEASGIVHGVQVRVTNPGDEDFTGTMTVRGGRGHANDFYPDASGSVEAPAEIPRRTTRELTVPLIARDWVLVEVAFRGAGRVLRVHEPVASLPEAFDVVLVGAGGRELTRRVTNYFEDRDKRRPLRLTVLGQDELPHHASVLEPADLIVLHGVNLGGADPRAIDAVRRWVERGGSLLAIPGPSWAGGVPGATLELLGLSRVAAPEAGSERWQLEPARGAARPRWPVVSVRGAGMAVTSAVSITPFPDPGESTDFDAAAELALDGALGVAGRARGLARVLADHAASELQSKSSFRVPPGSAIITALAVYVALGFLLPAFVFRRPERREWTFVWIACVAVAATVGIVRFGVLSSVGGLELHEYTVLRAGGPGVDAAATSFVGAISPRYDTIDLADPGLIPSLFEPVGANAPVDRTVSATGQSRVEPVSLRPNAMRCFRYDYTVPLAEFLELSGEAGALRATNRRDTLAYLYRNGIGEPRPLAPGGSVLLSELGGGWSAGRSMISNVLWNSIDAGDNDWFVAVWPTASVFPAGEEARSRSGEVVAIVGLDDDW